MKWFYLAKGAEVFATQHEGEANYMVNHQGWRFITKAEYKKAPKA
jgi:beta-lactamase superfamily II metal-dependent hydrolase